MRQLKRRVWPFFIVVATGISACGGRVDDRAADQLDAGARDGAVHREAGGSTDASTGVRDGSASKLDASEAADASDDGPTEASTDAGVVVPDANVCSSGGALTIAGDYVAPDKTEYWLRKSATATTYTIVPNGAGAPAALPQLFRVTTICPHWLSLAGTDGTVARLDWAEGASSLRVCVRPATSSAGIAKLPDPDEADVVAGCGGAPWIQLTRTSP